MANTIHTERYRLLIAGLRDAVTEATRLSVRIEALQRKAEREDGLSQHDNFRLDDAEQQIADMAAQARPLFAAMGARQQKEGSR